MKEKYLISVDQSTQGTKALLFAESGRLLSRVDLPHKQIVNELGWVSHDPEEIFQNTVAVIRQVIEKNKINKDSIVGIGISNQRETSVLWDRMTRKPLADAVVWQCARAEKICQRVHIKEQEEKIYRHTGLRLSPYFPAAKIAWLLEETPRAMEMAKKHQICHGTIDSWLVFRLTNGTSYKTDYSNASRTQLFNINTLQWDEEICALFGIDPMNLPEVCESNSLFGMTDLNGYFEKPVPIHSVLGDSHAALFGQGCLQPGMLKATYGTGSSIMMNIGEAPVQSSHGVVTSLAWGMDGKVNYVLEGNLNYTGAVITWLKDGLNMIASAAESEAMAKNAVKEDELYMVPAFTGLNAPYWNSTARAAILGMDRTTGRNEIVRASLECIAYQITDIVKAMEEDANVSVKQLRVDGGPTKNNYLMQFQSDILDTEVLVPEAEELSGIGAAYAAGIALSLWDHKIMEQMHRTRYHSKMDKDTRERKYAGWKRAVLRVL